MDREDRLLETGHVVGCRAHHAFSSCIYLLLLVRWNSHKGDSSLGFKCRLLFFRVIRGIQRIAHFMYENHASCLNIRMIRWNSSEHSGHFAWDYKGKILFGGILRIYFSNQNCIFPSII